METNEALCRDSWVTKRISVKRYLGEPWDDTNTSCLVQIFWLRWEIKFVIDIWFHEEFSLTISSRAYLLWFLLFKYWLFVCSPIPRFPIIEMHDCHFNPFTMELIYPSKAQTLESVKFYFCYIWYTCSWSVDGIEPFYLVSFGAHLNNLSYTSDISILCYYIYF